MNDEIPSGWKVVDRTPSGLHRLLPEDYEPPQEHTRPNLPFNQRPQNMYVVKAWVFIGAGLAGFGFFGLFYLWWAA